MVVRVFVPMVFQHHVVQMVMLVSQRDPIRVFVLRVIFVELSHNLAIIIALILQRLTVLIAPPLLTRSPLGGVRMGLVNTTGRSIPHLRQSVVTKW
jgi:hypothetical protein